MKGISSAGTDLAAMRRLNASAVLALLWDEPAGLPASAIAKRVGLSRSTVDALLAELMEDHPVSATLDRAPGAARSARAGRPARVYAIDADRAVTIGIQLDPAGARAVVGNLRGSRFGGEARFDSPLRSREQALDGVSRVVDRVLATTRHSLDDVAAVAVAVPAVVCDDGRLVLSTVAPEWTSGDLSQELCALFPQANVHVDNDTKLAALAEVASGGIAPEETGVLLRVESRISAATVLRGVVARGAHGAAGEIGALRRLGWMSHGAGQHRSSGAFAGEDPVQLARSIADGVSALVLAVDADTVVVNAPESMDAVLVEALAPLVAERTLFPPAVRDSVVGPDPVLTGALLAGSQRLRAASLEPRVESVL